MRGRIDKRRRLGEGALPMSDDTPPPSGPPGSSDVSPADVPAANVPAADVPQLDVPPDRLSISPRSPWYDADKLMRGIGIRFKGNVRHNVEEYCISEGWVRVQAGRTMDRKGKPLMLKVSGDVEAWYEDLGEGAPVAAKL
jgi:hypothetical protein